MKWFLYRLDWNQEKGKYDKAPSTLDGQRYPVGIPTVAIDDRTHVERCLDSLPQDGAHCYALGMIPDAGEKMFFFDLDFCVNENNQLDELSQKLVHPFLAAGAYFEGTSSGKGVHVIGRYTGELPPYAHKRPKVHTYEFYTETQGIALNRKANTGTWDADCTSLLQPLLREWFPPAGNGVEQFTYKEHGPRDDWDGPANDDELIAKALGAKGSAGAAFGTSLSFAQLWKGLCEKNNETDLALASHLAFWTGCDVDRVVRLMLRSGLVRDKWSEHRTYLRELTVIRACSTTRNVYKQVRVAVPALLTQLQGSDTDWYKQANEVVDRIYATQDLKVLIEEVMPAIGPMGIPQAYAERVVQALSKRLQLFDNKLPISRLRAIVSPPKVQAITDAVMMPEWAQTLCYVKVRDKFMDVSNGSMMSAEGLRMTYAGKMPFKNNGQREDVVTWARERWMVPVVDDVLYRPDQAVYFMHAGLQFANSFLQTSVPDPVYPTAECTECIELFKAHLWLIAGKRTDVYTSLLLWLAHNVQFPGRKIRWSPLVKGVQGDGKSIVLDLMLAVMGYNNVKITSPSTLTNSGGFTDWATGKALNFIEEIRLIGQEKHRLFNAMKLFIGDTLIDLNRKTKASGESMVNVTNHWANTNYEDALPTDNRERRWMIVFSPYSTIEDAVKAKGLADVTQLVLQFKRMGQSMRAEPGAWRAWLLGADLSEFDPDARAPHTDERSIMSAFSEEPIEHVVRDVIESGGPGITVEIFSSTMLRRALKIRAQLEDLQVPNSTAWHSLLARLGYRPWAKVVKIGNLTQQIWTKNDFHGDQTEISNILRKTYPNL